MDYDRLVNLPKLFFDQADRLGDKLFLWAKRDGRFVGRSWKETAAEVSSLSRGLRALGIGVGDRVVLVCENRPEWLIADIAIMAAGAVSVPAYVTNTSDDHFHILNNSGAKAAIVSTAALAERLLPAAARIKDLNCVVTLEPADAGKSGVRLRAWKDLVSLGERQPDDVRERVGRIKRNELSCIIYTSGTGGLPKGVALSHGSMISNCKGAYKLLLELGLSDEVFLCFLPLSHSYEHTAGMFFPTSIGAQIYYSSAETLAQDMVEVRPTIMTAVPRLYESLHQRIRRGVDRERGLKRALFEKALELGTRRLERPESLTLGDRLIDLVVDKLVRNKVRGRFGGRLKALVSGGAPLSYDIGLFFTSLGLLLLQGYGQTEAAPVVSCNPPSRVKLRTVGPPLCDVEVKIAEDGEILVRGELVMQGYWNDPAATASTIRDGWLHTGDIGVVDSDGYIQITDRKKDIIVNSGGDNVSPARVESALTLQAEIAQAYVHGDRHPYLVGLLVPDADFAENWAKANNRSKDLAALANDRDFHAAMDAVVERVNKTLSLIERVRRFALATEPFTVANGQMTPSLKIRRHAIRKSYGERLEALYEAQR
ncbi:MAG: long-chain fatty acid--CoA ligase [Rhodospirillaceae bacterium]|nr:long-chain fatty acid--CoA ligase [Rhodospirillaceae bacterium]